MSDKTSDKRLLPCPFCGGEAVLTKGLCELDNYIVCVSCRTRTKFFNTKGSAITAWNTRKPMERILERLEEYRDDFVDDIYEELRDDSDNLRANRIIGRFDEAIRIVKEEMEVE